MGSDGQFTGFFPILGEYTKVTETHNLHKCSRTVSITYDGKFPNQSNSTKVGVQVGVADIINQTKFGNDHSKGVQKYRGSILPRSIGMDCRL